jgi:nucleotide-binding universal stress UspA family protein
MAWPAFCPGLEGRRVYKHILIATDGSELAQRAVTHGLTLAKSVGARVTFLSATTMWSAMEMTGHAQHGEQHPINDFEARSAKWANKILAACKEQADQAGVQATSIHVSDTDPDRAIVQTAKARECDLIVMASHGRGPIGRLLLGSVALKVLTYTTIPVQIVR